MEFRVFDGYVGHGDACVTIRPQCNARAAARGWRISITSILNMDIPRCRGQQEA